MAAADTTNKQDNQDAFNEQNMQKSTFNSPTLRNSSGKPKNETEQNQLLLVEENRSTALNTNAWPSEGAHPDDSSNTNSDNIIQTQFKTDSQSEAIDPDNFEWRGVVFPELDCLDLRAIQNGKEITMRAYRWPAANNERKAVVFMMHGYGSCCAQMAHIAKYLAEDGFEVFGMDMRGMGDSEGVRGQIDRNKDVYDDYWALIFEATKKYKIDQQRTPIFLFGRSFGGLIATNMANTTIGKAMFAGVMLLTPYYRLFTERLYQAYKWLVPLVKVRPNHIFECEYEQMPEDYIEKYRLIFEDKRNVLHFTAVTAKLWVEEQAVSRENIKQVPQPFCFVAASKDGVVRNDYIQEYVQLCPNKLSEYHEIIGADHTDVCFDERYGSQLVRHSIDFFNRVIVSRTQ